MKNPTTFPQLDYKIQPFNPKISVLSAANKLKQAEDKLLQAKKRQIVQKRIQQACLAREQQKRKTQMFKKIVRNSLQMEKKLKAQARIKRQKEIQQNQMLSTSFRENHFKIKSTVKQHIKEQNQSIYLKIKEAKIKNEKMVRQFHKKQLQHKIQNRMNISEKQVHSKQKVKSFRQSRIVFIQRQRQLDVKELEKKTELKEKYLNKLKDSRYDFYNTQKDFKYRSNSSFQSERNSDPNNKLVISKNNFDDMQFDKIQNSKLNNPQMVTKIEEKGKKIVARENEKDSKHSQKNEFKSIQKHGQVPQVNSDKKVDQVKKKSEAQQIVQNSPSSQKKVIEKPDRQWKVDENNKNSKTIIEDQLNIEESGEKKKAIESNSGKSVKKQGEDQANLGQAIEKEPQVKEGVQQKQVKQ